MKEDDIRLRDFREGVKSLIVIGYPKEKGLTKANVWSTSHIVGDAKILVTVDGFSSFHIEGCNNGKLIHYM